MQDEVPINSDPPATPVKIGIGLIVLSGPSGSGKSTVVDRVIAQSKVKLLKGISATTRAARDQEVDGEDYYFLSSQEFAERQRNNEFLEYEQVHNAGYWYGTLWSELGRIQDAGGWAFLEIDVNGALRVMKKHPSALTIFLKTANEADFEKRLRSRGTESEEAIQRRLEAARSELKMAHHYQYEVVNDDLDRAVNEIVNIIANREAEQNA